MYCTHSTLTCLCLFTRLVGLYKVVTVQQSSWVMYHGLPFEQAQWTKCPKTVRQTGWSVQEIWFTGLLVDSLSWSICIYRLHWIYWVSTPYPIFLGLKECKWRKEGIPRLPWASAIQKQTSAKQKWASLTAIQVTSLCNSVHKALQYRSRASAIQ